MALIMQPKWLPEPLREGYGLRHVSPQTRSTFVSGRSMPRRAYTATPSQTEVRWLLNDQQSALFEKWFQEQLFDGVSWFACRLRSPLGMDYYKARFTDIYDGPTLTNSNLWMFTAQLELYLRPLLADGWSEYPEGFLQANVIDLAANREWPQP
ncbi:hypothetical protein [Stenotrophomonas maltophilia]|uniref:hypothetical protein n=1 Tax=Stenotrophomonas maltophilia TaxID=40324 RepID=UPI001C608932|nr:hypothetical protein [Stenotrophomonas maltophilia]